MYPEVLGADDTENTNVEEQSLHTFISTDGENKIFPHTKRFLPYQSGWVYNWLTQVALPRLHPGTSLKRVEKIISDAHPSETRALENICGYTNTNLNTSHCATVGKIMG